MRALVPLTAGSFGTAIIGWRVLLLREAQHQAVQLLGRQLVGLLEDSLWEPLITVKFWFYLASVFLAWELRVELLVLSRLLLQAFTTLVVGLAWLFGWFLVIVNGWWQSSRHRAAVELGCHVGEERGEDLTSMAVVAAAAAADPVPFPRGTFLLVSRPPSWDEVWIAGYVNGATDILARTTLPDGSDWCWVVVRLVGMAVKPPVIRVDGSRGPPAGVAAQSINWIYTPPDCNQIWEADAVEVVSLSQEANLILNQLGNSLDGVTVNTAGAGGDLVPLVLMGAQGMMGPGGHAQNAGGNPGGAGLGLRNKDGMPSSAELSALEKAVQQLQALALSGSSKDKKAKKQEKKKKKKKSRRSSKKSRKKKRKSSSSSSSSGTSRSRSRSSSRSSSTSDSKKPLVWSDKAKDKRVDYQQLTHVDQLKFKKKGDLVAFAAKHPGALTAHFLASVYNRLSKGTISRSSQLRDPSVAAWAQIHSGLTEPRDLKEVQTLGEVLDHVNRREIARAMDVLCQRIIAIQAARGKGGSWEKAEALELVNTQKALASSSMLALTYG